MQNEGRNMSDQRKIFKTEKAAITGGPYSQAIIHNGIIYVSGQGAVNPETNQIELGTVAHETRLAMQNLSIILQEAGSALDKTLTITAYLLDMNDYAEFNQAYLSFFKGDLPTRTCIQAANLPFDTRVEITATAFI